MTDTLTRSGETPGSMDDAPRPGVRGVPALALLDGLPLSVLAGLTAWLAVNAWRGMIDEPGRFLGPLLLAAVLIAVVGWGVRRVAGPWVALTAQLVVLLLWLLHRVSGHWLPTPGSVRDLVTEVVDGALAGQRYVSPVSTSHPEFGTVLLLGGIGIVLAVDLLSVGLRRPALAGLPLLLAITIAASVLLTPVSWLLFTLTAFGWLALVALQESTRLGAWGRGSTGGNLGAAGGLTVKIAVLCAVIAIVLTSGLSSAGRNFGNFGGSQGNGSLTVANPLLDLRRNLRQGDDIPLVRVSTDGAGPSYLRTTVLDVFTGRDWQPSDRSVSTTSVVSGSLPPPPGLNPLNQGPTSDWRVRVDKNFPSRWLPTPYPTSTLTVGDSWRYDADTMDVIGVGDTTAAGLDYQLRTYQPQVNPNEIRSAGMPPQGLQRQMTALPADLPTVFRRTARRVTQSASNDYDRAVRLQDWFRADGGFRYSTQPAPGSGIATLERFITTDKVGYCEQFSTAMAVMARSLGIPARVAVGFLRADKSGANSYTFSAHDLHAWPELYFEGVGWIRFEPTPADRTGSAPSYTIAQTVPEESSAPSANALPTAQPSQAKPTVAPVNGDATGKGAGQGFQWGLLAGVLVLLLLVALSLTPRLLRRTTARRRWASARTPQALADAAWTEVRATAVDLDLGWSDQETVRGNGRTLQNTANPNLEARDALADVVRFVELTRYARPRDLTTEYRTRIRGEVDVWQQEMYRAVDPRRARRARWLPRSVVESLRRRATERPDAF